MNHILPDAPFPAPPDADAAHAEWGANCGPCALAAVLGKTLREVRPLFQDFVRRRYVNPTHMRKALEAAGVNYRVETGSVGWTPDVSRWKGTLLLFVQWEGPWTRGGAPIGAAYRNTHWVGVRDGWTYDVNYEGGWLRPSEWVSEVAPHLIRHTPRATGWYVRTVLSLWRSKAVPQ